VSCWSCRAWLAPDASYCPRCGESQSRDEWVECKIGYRPGHSESRYRRRLYGEFTATFSSESHGGLAGRSGPFRCESGGGGPTRTLETEARLAELCRALELEGWARLGDPAPDPWYALSYRRYVGRQRDRNDQGQPDELEPTPARSLALVESTPATATVAAAEEPEVAVVSAPRTPEAPAPATSEGPVTPSPDVRPPSLPESAEPDNGVVTRPWYQQPIIPPAAPRSSPPAEIGLASRIIAYAQFQLDLPTGPEDSDDDPGAPA
jgi:hypothetical protein